MELKFEGKTPLPKELHRKLNPGPFPARHCSSTLPTLSVANGIYLVFKCPSTCRGCPLAPVTAHFSQSWRTSRFTCRWKGEGFVYPVQRISVSELHAFLDPFAEKACERGSRGSPRAHQRRQPARPVPARPRRLHSAGEVGGRRSPAWCAPPAPGAAGGGAGGSAGGSAEGDAGGTGPSFRRPARGWSRGPAPRFPSRAAAPANQRPQRAGSRFKLRRRRLAGIGAGRPRAPRRAAWSTASWGPGRTGPPSW